MLRYIYSVSYFILVLGRELHTEPDLKLLYAHLQHHYDTINKQRQEDFFRKIYTSHFICKGTKGLLKGCVWEGAGDRNCNILTPLLWPSTLCLSCSPDAGVYSVGYWLSLLHIISIFSGPQLIRAQMAPSAGCGFPYHISSITDSNSTATRSQLELNSIELYNSSTPTRSPTRSLKSHV